MIRGRREEGGGDGMWGGGALSFCGGGVGLCPVGQAGVLCGGQSPCWTESP